MENFKIICNSCGSSNCKAEEIYEYDWFENLAYDHTNIMCMDCGKEERV